MVRTKTYICPFFYWLHLVLLTMVPRNSYVGDDDAIADADANADAEDVSTAIADVVLTMSAHARTNAVAT